MHNSKNHGKMVSKRTIEYTIIKLCVEGIQGSFWGQVRYDDNLIVDEADSLESLQNKMKKLLVDFHELDPSTYEFAIEAV